VAYHGSSNRAVPTGYKVVRLDVEENRVVGEEDFITGWLLEDGSKVGRPVDLIFGPEDGALYITDDNAGVIYRVTREE
jgi:glucose/arabinose dehydrogenase